MKVCISALLVLVSFAFRSGLAQEGRGGNAASATNAAWYEFSGNHALIIGIDDYKHWDKLRCAVSDAKMVGKVLSEIYGFSDIRMLLNEKATREAILETLDRYDRLTDKDSLLLYYAGHGWMERGKKTGYWVPVEARKDKKSDFISNSELVGDYFRKWKVKHLLVIADSCFAGSMLRGVPSDRPDEWRVPDAYRKPSRWVLTSGDLQPVPDDSGTGSSPFAIRLTQYLQYGDAQSFGVLDVYTYLRQNLRDQTPVADRLDVESHMPGGEFVFVRTLSKAPRAVVGPTVVSLTGTLMLRSPVDSVVTLDGEGNYPIKANQALTWSQLAVGEHKLAVEAGNKIWKSSVQLEEGQTATVIAVFDDNNRPGDCAVADLGGGVRIELCWIPATTSDAWKKPNAGKDTFAMGTPVGEPRREDDEIQHDVKLTKGYWIGKYEITQEQWEKVMGGNISGFKAPKNPVESVSWDDCREFCRKLTAQARGKGGWLEFRLPTEAEWEYACRAGSKTKFSFGYFEGQLYKHGNYCDAANTDGSSWQDKEHNDGHDKTAPVGSFKANVWGLYDVHGNVWEWCSDWHGQYPDASADPAGPSSGEDRVIRGGSWGRDMWSCRSARREKAAPGYRSLSVGLRVVGVR